MTVFSYQEAYFQKGSPLYENPQKQSDVVEFAQNSSSQYPEIDLEIIHNN